jgi:hypothetical protein
LIAEDDLRPVKISEMDLEDIEYFILMGEGSCLMLSSGEIVRVIPESLH